MKLQHRTTAWARLRTLAPALIAVGLLAGCAGLRSVSSDVSSYGDWPAARQPGTYAFERLPSQQARAAESEALENSARAGLERAGFKAAEPGREPDVLVQVGAQTTRTDSPLWDDPLWWRGGFGGWRYGPWVSPRWGGYWAGGYGRYGHGFYGPWGPDSFSRSPRYENQVGLLIRDRATGKPLFETRASNDGFRAGDEAILGALFQAALTDFPRVDAKPRRVVVALPQGQ